MLEIGLILTLVFGSGYTTRWLTEDKLVLKVDDRVFEKRPKVCKETSEAECVENPNHPKPWIIMTEQDFIRDKTNIDACRSALKSVIDYLK